jgi:hypothetical protein
MLNDDSIQSMGGKARADVLSPEQRAEIAKKAAEARWSLPKATHTGNLKIQDANIECHVLADGTRLLSRASLLKSIGRTGKAKGGRAYDEEFGLPVFLTANNLKPFITNDLIENSKPVRFIPVGGGAVSLGYRAELLPLICAVFMDAYDADKTSATQDHIVQRCKMLLRGFAVVGINALVDEATGYQYVRDRQALQKILELYLLKEFAAWAKRFPDDFYKELFRLRGWTWNHLSVARPGYVVKLTNDLVYERLAPGILDELKSKNPKTESGNRKTRHHQWLTEDVGHPALAQHLHATIALMKVATDWKTFYAMIERALPKKIGQLPLLLDI